MKIYHTPEWKKLRWRVLRRDHFQCTACQKSVQGRGKSRVDHILTVRERPDLAFDIDNLRTLCPSCDNKRHAEKGRKGSDLGGCDVSGLPTNPAHPWNA